MRREEHVASMEGMKNVHKILVVEPEDCKSLGELGIDGRITVRGILKKGDVKCALESHVSGWCSVVAFSEPVHSLKNKSFMASGGINSVSAKFV